MCLATSENSEKDGNKTVFLQAELSLPQYWRKDFSDTKLGVKTLFYLPRNGAFGSLLKKDDTRGGGGEIWEFTAASKEAKNSSNVAQSLLFFKQCPE